MMHPDDERVTAPILVVDDRREDLLVLEEVLRGPGYEILTASSGTEALRRVLERDFAVIVLDVMMPEMDGLELATLIKHRERSRHTPMIFLTAAGSDIRGSYRAYSVGAVDYLSKPLDRDLIRAKVAIFADLFRKDLRIKKQAEALREADRRETELALAELELKNRQRYQNLAEAIPQIVWTAKADGAVDYCNKRWSEYTGLGLDRTRGDGWLSALHPDDARSCFKAWRTAVQSGENYRTHCRLRRGSDAAYRWHQIHAVPERDADGAIVGFLGTYSDFEDLKRALDVRDEFLSVASHELRTPMTALQLNLQSLRRMLDGSNSGKRFADDGVLEAAVSTKVGKAVLHVQRLARLVDDLLDVSRITTGRLELERGPCDLGEVAEEVVERLADQAGRAGCTLSVDTTARAIGNWDHLRLEQVVTNLVSNALRYAPGAPVEIAIEQSDGNARLTVRDHGPGLKAEDLARIFERFERATALRNHGGLGIGLYIAREIVRTHGGTIVALSNPGEGAAFVVELPLQVRVRAPIEAAQ
jgi:PAS domain S-box-containing protein